MPEWTLTDEQAVDEVRAALAGIDESKVSDTTVKQSINRFSKPWVDQHIDPNADQNLYESAVIVYAAEHTFNSWLTKTRMRDAELEVFTDPRVYTKKLRQRTDEVFTSAGISRPPRQKHYQEAVKPEDSE